MNRDPNNWRPAVVENVECEGFYPAFVHYEDYKWIEDQKFHELRNKMIEAAKELSVYVGVDHEC